MSEKNPAVYTFHREEGFYPIELDSDDQARANAACNPGTLKVVNEFTGEVVFTIENPFIVPAFTSGSYQNKKTYTWWSWHPNYPWWSQSCWGGSTIEEARAALDKPMAINMKLYHNKLICEEGDKLTEVENRPCERLDVWQKIFEQRKAKP